MAKLEGAVAEQEREVQLQTKEAEEEMVGGRGWRRLLLETSLLRMLQAQTLPDAIPPMGKLHSFSKMAVTSTFLFTRLKESSLVNKKVA